MPAQRTGALKPLAQAAVAAVLGEANSKENIAVSILRKLTIPVVSLLTVCASYGTASAFNVSVQARTGWEYGSGGTFYTLYYSQVQMVGSGAAWIIPFPVPINSQALSAGGASGLVVFALTPRASATKAAELRHDEPRSSGENAPTIIERQVIVREASPVTSAQAPSTTPTEGESMAAVHSEPVDRASEMEYMFQNDRALGEEGRRFESLLREGFRDPGMTGAKVGRIDCKAVTCRVEVTFDDREADSNAIHAMIQSPVGIMNHGKSMTIPIRNTLSDGRVAATMYFYPSLPPVPRPGESPPS